LREQILVPEPIDEASQAIGRPHGPKYRESHRPEGAGGRTGSRNMAATRFFDFSTPTSYSTPNTLGGLSRTVMELPPGGVTITPLLRPLATRKYCRDGDVANFKRTLLEIVEFNFPEIFSIVRRHVCLSNAVKKSKICLQSSEQK